MSNIYEKAIKMTPQISPKDIPQNMNESDCEEEPVYSDNIQVSSSSEDEDDEDIDTSPQGYVPLSMNDGNETPDCILQDSEEDSTVPASNENQVLQVNKIVNDSSSSSVIQSGNAKELPMDSDQVNLIQQVMSRISLPSTSIPEWANIIPEDKWKTSLLTSLENRTHSTSSSKCNMTETDK